jgi:hypothetical protein
MGLENTGELIPATVSEYLPIKIRESSRWKPLKDQPLHFALSPFEKMLDAYPEARVADFYNFDTDVSTVCCQLDQHSLIRLEQPPALPPTETTWLDPELQQIKPAYSVFHIHSTQLDAHPNNEIKRAILGSHFLVFIADEDNPFRFFSTTITYEHNTGKKPSFIYVSTPASNTLTTLDQLQLRKTMLTSPEMTTIMISQEESYPVGIAERTFTGSLKRFIQGFRETKTFVQQQRTGDIIGPIVNRLYYEFGIRIPAPNLGYHQPNVSDIFGETQQIIIDKVKANLGSPVSE